MRRTDQPDELLFVANKRVPPGDYRVQYALQCGAWRVRLGMPGRPEGLPPEQFEPMGFGEGIGIGDIPAFWRLFRHLRRNRRRVLFVQFFSTKLTLLGPLVAKLAGVRSLATVTGFGRVFNDRRRRYRALRPLYRAMLRLSALCCARVLFQNRSDLDQATRWMPRIARRFAYVGSGVAGRVVPRRDDRERPLRVLMVARLLPSKGIRDFLEVAERMQGEDVRFVLIGPRSVGCDELHGEVERHAARGVVDYLGELHGGELDRQYGESDVFVLTSHGEGLPRVLLEAGFAGLCPVAYDLNANRDLIRQGGGFLVPIGDRAAIQRVLSRLMVDRDLLRRNAERFQAHVARGYSMEEFTRRLDGILRGIAPAARRNRARAADAMAADFA